MAFNITDFNNRWANFKEELKDYFNKRVVDKNGDTMSGELHILSNPSADDSATTVRWVKNYQHPWTCDTSKPMESVICHGNGYGGAYKTPVLQASGGASTSNGASFSTSSQKFYIINDGEIQLNLFFSTSYQYGHTQINGSVYKNNDKVFTYSPPPELTYNNGQGINILIYTTTLKVNKGDVLQLCCDGSVDYKYRVALLLSIDINTGSPYKYNVISSGIIQEQEV